MPVLRQESIADLADDFALPGPDGMLSLWWPGGDSFALRMGATRILIDPRVPLEPGGAGALARGAVARVDLVLSTGIAADAARSNALAAIAAAVPSCRFVVPAAEMLAALAAGVPRERLMPAEGERELAPLPSLRLVPFRSSGAGPSAGRSAGLGYILSTQGLMLFHCDAAGGRAEIVPRLRAYLIDLAVLPVAPPEAGPAGRLLFDHAVTLCKDAGIRFMLGHGARAAPAGARSATGFGLLTERMRYDLARR